MHVPLHEIKTKELPPLIKQENFRVLKVSHEKVSYKIGWLILASGDKQLI